MEWQIGKSKLITSSLSAVLLFAMWSAIADSFVSPEPRATISSQGGTIIFSPDGKTAITFSGSGFSRSGPIQVWDVGTGRERLALAQGWNEIETVDVSADSRLLGAHQKEGILKVWSLETGKELMSFKPVTFYGNWVNFRFCPDGKSLMFDDFRGNWRDTSRVTFREIKSGKDWATVETYFWWIEFADRGSKLVNWVSTDRKQFSSLRVLALDPDLHRVHSLINHAIVADGVAVSPDRRSFACFKHPDADDSPATVEVRDTDSGVLRCKLVYTDKKTHIQSLSFSPDGGLLVSHGGGGTQLSWKTRSTVWDISKVPARELASFSEAPVVSGDGKWLAVPTDDGADLYEVPSMKKVVLNRPGDNGPSGNFNGLKSYPRLEFSPDGKMLAVSGLWHQSQEPLAIQWIAKYILRMPSEEYGPIVRLWDVPTGNELASFKGSTEAKFSPDGRTLATAGSGGKIRLWDVPLRKPIGRVVTMALPFWGLSLLGLWLWKRWRSRTVAM